MAKKEILNNDALTVRVDEAPIEAALETAEHVVEQVVTVTRNNPYLIAGALLVGLGVGAFVGYKVAEKRLEARFEAELGEQIAAAKSFHKRLTKEDYPTPESAVEALVPDEVVEAVNSYQGREKRVPYNRPDAIVEEAPKDPRPPVEVVVEEAVVQQNVFVQAEAEHDPRDWDYRLEVADREANPNQPYVISFEEFNENELNHEQANLSYYAQDDTLADSKDAPVDNTEYTVGDDNLTRFGHGSNDPNVVYVRNEKLSMDFEIVRSNGSYQKEVLGFEPEVRHAHRRPNRRQWRADE